MKRYWYHIEAFGLMVVMSLLFVLPTNAQFNPEINYQGKLTDSSGVAVPDGTYQMVFRLYTAPTGGTAIWTETLSGANEVSVVNGLFSVMLGSTSALTAADFNQTLYLGVTIESDSEMTPRKILGAVPAAFVAEEANNAATVGGVASSSFVRSDQADSIAATTASTLLSITQSGTGNILDVFDGASSALTILDGGNVGIGTSSPSQLLSVGGNAYITGTITGATWGGATIAATRGGTGLSTITQNQLLIGGAGNTWTQVATSSLGLSASFSNSSQLAALLSDETGTENAVFSASPTFTGTMNAAAATLSSTLTLSGTAANIALGSNYLSGDGDDEGIYVDASGNVGIGTTSISERLDVAGNIRVTNLRTYGLTRTMPTVVNEAVDIGSFTFSNGAGALRLSIGVLSSGHSIAKEYIIPVAYNETSGGWVIAQPISDTGSYGAGANNFELDVNINNAVALLRIRRTAGAVNGTAYVTIKQEGNSNNAFSASTATSSVSAPSSFYGATAITQVGGNVGIGTSAPSQLLSVGGNAYITGTITGATWGGATLNAGVGGTGVTAYSAGDLLYAASTNPSALSRRAIGTTGQVLTVSGGLPTWSSTSTLGIAISDTTGTLDVNRGGTGATTHTAGSLLVGNGTSAITSTTTAGLKSTLALNNVENTALSTWTGSTNITTLGTVTSGTWTGSVIGDAYLTKTGAWTGTFDGQEGSYYLDATNLNAGTLASARLTGAYSGITGLGTLTSLAVSGTSTLATTTLASTTVMGDLTITGTVDGVDVSTLASIDSSEITNSTITDSDISYAYDIATDPALAANTIFFGNTGLIFEGSSADGFEGLLTTTNPTADRTWTLPNTTGTIALTSSAMTGTFDGNNFAGGAIATGDLLYGSGAGTIAELTIGSTGQVLTVSGGLPAWSSTSSLGLSASFSNSSQLAGLLSDETGSGNAVFSASPTFTGLTNFADLFATNASTTNATTTNLAISSLTSGRVPFATTGGSLIDSANLTFDGARFLTLNLAVSGTSTFTGTSTFSGRIGVGTTSPSSLIDIWGDARFGTTSTPALFVNTATNQTQFPSGSVSTPGFSFYNDGNTGLYQGSGANSLTVVTGGNDMFEFGNGYMSAAEDINFTDTYGVVWGAGENTSIRAINGSSGYIQIRGNATEHFRIMNATGNVGIGSTSPSSKLTVTGSFSLSGAFRDSSNSAGTSGMILKTTGTGTEWVATSSLGLAAASDLASYLPLTGGTLSGNLTFSGSSANIALGSNWLSGDGGDEGIYVDSSGNVGVGTTTTTLGKLSVAQTAANQGVTVFGAGANASNFGSLFVTGSGELVLQAGGLGLGGLAGTSQTVAIWNNNTLGLLNDKELSFGTSGDYSIGYNSGDDTFRIVDGLDVAANTRLLINASGYVGIGTTSPMSLLSVAGASVFTGQMNMVGASANIALGSNWLSGDGGDEGLLVNSFGEVNIGSTTSAGGLLQIGSVYYPSVGARALNIDTMIVSSSTTFHGVAATPTFAPLTDLTSAYGIINRPTFASSSNNIANAFGTYSRFDTAADYTGTITKGYSYFAGPVTQSGTKPVANYYHYFASNITNGNGTTSGAIENAAFWSSGLTAEAGSGGSVTNYGLRLTQPSGNTTGTNNYGIYISGSGGASASNNYSFYNASVANSYFDGKVGIGSTSPAWPLSVTGQAAIDGPLRVAGVSVFSGRILTGGVTTGQNAAISLGGTHQPFIQEHGTARNEGSTALFVWANNAAGPELSFNKSRGAAIGTQTIVNNADVLGAVVFAGSDGTNPIPAASIQGEVDGAPSTNDMPGRLIFSTTLNGDSAPTEHMRITNAGYVGIGTTTPVSKLVLQASPNYGQMDIVASTANGEAGLLFKSADDSDANGWLIGKNLAVTDDSFSVYRNGTNHMVVNTTGYVGIGTTTPKSPIHIYANVGSLESVERNSTTASGWTQYLRNGVILGYVGFDSSTGGSLSTNGLASSFHVRAENALQFSAGGAGVDLTIDTTGNVGVGTTTPADKFQAYGDIRVGTGTTGCVKDADGTTIAGTCSSDERLKMDITPLASSSKSYLEALVAIEPSTYYWNEVASDEFRYGTTSIQTGLIAQQVALTMPEMVTEDHRGYKQVRFSDLPIYLLQAIKEMWSIVDGFKEQFTTKELCIGDTCVTEAELQTLLQNAQQQPSSQPPSVPDQDPSSDPATEGGDSGVTDDSGATDTPPAEDNPPAEPPPDGSTDGSSGAGGG